MPVHDRSRFEKLDADQPRWEIGRPQQAILDRAHQITGSVVADDLAGYSRRGLGHVTTFAVQMNPAYLRHHPGPQPLLDAYGKALGEV